MKIKKFEFSKKFLRAVQKELEQLARLMNQLEERERQLAAEQAALLEELNVLNAQIAILDQIAETDDKTATMPTAVLRGRRIPEVAIQIMLKTSDPHRALHYRQWYSMLNGAGFLVLSERPHAAFLASFSRSPLICPVSGRPGVYAIDFKAPSRIKSELKEAEAELQDMIKSFSCPQFSRVNKSELDVLEARVRKLRRDLKTSQLLDLKYARVK